MDAAIAQAGGVPNYVPQTSTGSGSEAWDHITSALQDLGQDLWTLTPVGQVQLGIQLYQIQAQSNALGNDQNVLANVAAAAWEGVQYGHDELNIGIENAANQAWNAVTHPIDSWIHMQELQAQLVLHPIDTTTNLAQQFLTQLVDHPSQVMGNIAFQAMTAAAGGVAIETVVAAVEPVLTAEAATVLEAEAAEAAVPNVAVETPVTEGPVAPVEAPAPQAGVPNTVPEAPVGGGAAPAAEGTVPSPAAEAPPPQSPIPNSVAEAPAPQGPVSAADAPTPQGPGGVAQAPASEGSVPNITTEAPAGEGPVTSAESPPSSPATEPPTTAPDLPPDGGGSAGQTKPPTGGESPTSEATPPTSPGSASGIESSQGTSGPAGTVPASAAGNPWADVGLRPNAFAGTPFEAAIEGSYVENAIPLSNEVSPGHYIYVVDSQHNMWLAPVSEGVHHSSLIPAGAEVLSAGELVITEEGAVGANAASGHYMADLPLVGGEIPAWQNAMSQQITEAGLHPVEFHPDATPITLGQ